MKRYVLFLFLFALLSCNTSVPVNAQILKPVKWSFSSEPIAGKPGQYHLYFDATIDDGWYVYSQFLAPDGPNPTIVMFDDSTQVKFLAKPGETGAKIKDEYDKLFDMQIKKFGHSARFTQTICVVNDKKPIKGAVSFMTCKDVCIFPDPIPFEFNLKGGDCAAGKGTGAIDKPKQPEPTLKQPDTTHEVAVVPPAAGGNDTTQNNTTATTAPVAATGMGVCYNENLLLPNLHLDKNNLAGQSGLLTIFILGFLGGLVALITPCVFPMIPLTVSFFTKGADKGKTGVYKAMLYAFFIFLIYFLLSLPFHLINGIDASILNTISTNVYLNVGFFVIFVAFAISFFGYYEIGLPGNLGNKADSAADIGGILGIFFMALTLAIVSFSCTGPILGTLLGLTAQKGGNFANQLTAGMSGFGLALALPFGLFAAFPTWLNSLPKSGGWLNTVKVEIGFVELALALKFLSNADQVEHWGLLKREVFIGIWVIIGIATTLYLLGRFKFPHDSPVTKLSNGRIANAMVFFAFTLYLLPGLTNTKYANLSLISGFPPPLYYSIYDKSSNDKELENHKNDLCAAMAEAKRLHKPVMIDFTGFACVNCRRMEENVWTDDAVYNKIKDDYVLVSLYVDDKAPLPADQQITVTNEEGNPKVLKTVGNKWGTFQTKNFQNNSQPYYALISPDGQLLTEPVGYTPDKQQYLNFLEDGVKSFKRLADK